MQSSSSWIVVALLSLHAPNVYGQTTGLCAWDPTLSLSQCTMEMRCGSSAEPEVIMDRNCDGVRILNQAIEDELHLCCHNEVRAAHIVRCCTVPPSPTSMFAIATRTA